MKALDEGDKKTVILN
ncbi:hypothetical protein ORM92_25200 [Bacillus cereus]|uniref:Uncharacterized protein n=1 Tax=Bacillus wiedmannii TaxID=1890302 RepID=A0AA95LZ44_9BACI|nr:MULTISPECIES: hypothetical protein [Bacillus]MCP1178680.1 hypothetical protein [Bacillus sp. 1663tsa1]MCP1281891.1 hypothetical protein [Bacillus sp. S0635]MCE0554198.1 hypothetical protein [Bacillus thuringiensis]MCE9704912.1 hypothetical protein [Bacillus thuringiensis]MCE9754151.1 hypothetical protein [Bacillus cereus]